MNSQHNIHIIPAIIAIGIATLLGLLVYNFCKTHSTAIGITSGVSLAIVLFTMMAYRNKNQRININIRVVCSIFLATIAVFSIIMCFLVVAKLTVYFIISGLILLIFIGVIYSIVNAFRK